MQDVRVANDFLNGKLDAFSAVAAGNVLIKGQTPMIDSISLILNRVPLYLK
jgi:putative sterol carrier protein